jgi:hypothetical protein
MSVSFVEAGETDAWKDKPPSETGGACEVVLCHVRLYAHVLAGPPKVVVLVVVVVLVAKRFMVSEI